MVIARHEYNVEQIVNLLKGEATRALLAEGIHPLAAHAVADGKKPKAFGRGQWKVFLDSRTDIAKAIEYVRENPVKEGLPPQTWKFVTEYDP